ncbi:MAG: nitroreductase family protein [Erysipelotrichaceae bacterium]|nr:nitroreductase family protein [Erysipelotrichaceae bacterium]
MELNELVKIRRSVRAYSEERVKEEDLKEMISCAQMAPSWKNSETGRYYVALSDEAIEKIYESLPDFNKRSSKNAAYIVTTFKKGLSGYVSEGNPSPEGDLWGSYDLGLQNSYMLLKASELGYDTLIMGLRDSDAIREYFAIPEDEIIMAVIAIGKRAAEPKFNPRKNLEDILKIK